MPERLIFEGRDSQGNRVTRTLDVDTTTGLLPRMGMTTPFDEWAARVAETGPVNVRRVYAGSSWSHSSLVSRINACHAGGHEPFASMKNGGTVASWSSLASGAWDAQIDALGVALAQMPAPTRIAYHHEPRPASLSELAIWGRAHTRFNLRLKAVAGAKAIVGPVDNGFPWTEKNWGKLTDAELAIYYTDEFVASCDALGADFYDGETDTSAGEPAWPKARGFWRYWRERRGFTGRLDIGEWNFIEPEDVELMWQQLLAGRFSAACAFNSPENNRTDLPTDKGLGDPPSWLIVPGTPRMAAFRAVLDKAGIPGR